MQHRPVDRTDLQFYCARVTKFLRQWNLVPLKAWWPHVDGEQTVGFLPAIENTGGRFESECGLSALLRDQVGDTSHTISAGAGLWTIIVVDANECIRARGAWRGKSHQLIVGCPF